MHIVHIIPGDIWAGAESQVFYTLKELSKLLNKEKLEVILFNRGELLKKLNKIGISVTLFDESKLNEWLLLRSIRNFFLRKKVDIVHTHEYKSHILGRIALWYAKKGSFIVRTIHGLTYAPFRIGSIRSYFALMLDKLFLQYFTDKIIAVSKELEKKLLKELKCDQVICINNGICIDKKKLQIDVNKIRAKYGISKNQLWIATAARLVEVKNLKMLINAGYVLWKKYRDIDFVISIFGSGEEYLSLKKQIEKLGLNKKVILHGHKNDIIPILKAIDIFTLTSKHEGLPISLLEAMSAGAIPICTKVGGIKEVIQHKKNGLLVEVDNYDKLVDLFAYVYYNKKELQYIKKNAINTIKRHYSASITAQKLLETYEALYI